MTYDLGYMPDLELREIWNRVSRYVEVKGLDSETKVWKAMRGIVEPKWKPQIQTLLDYDFPKAFWERILRGELGELEDLEDELARLKDEMKHLIRLEEDLKLEREISLEKEIKLEKKYELEEELGFERDVELERIVMTQEGIKETKEHIKLLEDKISAGKVKYYGEEGILGFIPTRKVIS